MQSSLRIGRIGPLSIYLNYTWLFAFVLGLWWLALLWLPDNFPGWTGFSYWLVAVAAMLLFLFSVIAHELVHNLISGNASRNVILYPIGAAMPFRLNKVEPGKAVFSALAAPIFNIILGGILLLAVGSIGAADGVSGAIKGLLEPLGWLNLALGLVNLIPGIPFDGGWALSSTAYWFAGSREAGLKSARLIGNVAALAFVIVGAWRGLTTNSWLEALALVLVGWATHEAGALTAQRGLLRGAFNQLSAEDLMEAARPNDTVAAADNVAALVRTHPHFPPDQPIAVVDEANKLVGVVTLAATEPLLQGHWAATPVRALTTPLGELRAVRPDSDLNEVLALAHEREGAPDGELAIPVVDNGTLVGSISPMRLNAFTGLGQQFGIDETLDQGANPKGKARMWAALLPAAILIAALAILGNIALRTNPAEVRGLTADTAEAPIAFSNFSPSDGAIVGAGSIAISAQIAGPSAITTATITLDGQPLAVALSGSSPLTQTATANVPGLVQGPHNVVVTAGTDSGRTKKDSWQFRVSLAGQAEQTPVITNTAGGLRIVGYTPALGSRLPAGSADVSLTVDVTGKQPPSTASIWLDGVQLKATITPAKASAEQYTVSAAAPKVEAGNHRVRAEITDGAGGFYSTEWTFTALAPDANNVYFKETGVFLSEPFLSYWRDNGGVGLFGYPISERVQETITQTGEVYTAKYFERARMELHQATGEQVILGRLGAIIHPPEPAVTPIAGAQFFPATGHNLAGPFLDFWKANGGLAVFGYPISEEITEKNPVDGKEYKVQYFERSRFELHPEHAGAPQQVQLGLLGTQLYNQKYKR